MSETSNPEHTAEQTTPPEIIHAHQQTPPPTVPKRRGGWVLLLILLLLSAASSYAAYYLWQQLQVLQTQNTAQNQPNQSSTQSLQNTLNHLQQQVDTLRPQYQQMQQQLQQVQTEQQVLQQAYRQLHQQMRRVGDREDWSIAEVGYLLRIAQQRLSLGNDVPAALRALQAADQRLRNAGPALLPVREQLTQDIQQLQGVQTPDIAGMALRLARYAQSSETLPLLQGQLQARSADAAKPVIKTADATASTPPSFLQALWAKAQTLVVIRYNDSADAGLLSPSQRGFLRDNVRVKLETARLLLLNRNTKQFQLEIKTLTDWLTGYYDLKHPNVATMHEDLLQMLNTPLTIPLPDLSKSLVILKQLEQAAEGHLSLLNSEATQVTP